MNPPAVTVAIPTYNGEKTIEKAILSALNQSWPNIEILVINNGSTDKTAEIIERFRGAVLHVFFKEKIGRAKARNEALQRANGHWIQWLDHDDYLEPNKIKNHFSLTTELDAIDVFYSPIIAVSPEGKEKYVPSAETMHKPLLSLWFSSELPQTGGYLWKKESAIKIGGWSDDAPLFDDYELVGRAIQSNLRFSLTPIPGAYWNYRDKPMPHEQALDFIDQKKKCMDRMVQWLVQTGRMDPELQIEIGKAYFLIARWLAREGKIEEAVALERKQKALGLFFVDGSWRYNVLYSLFGFFATEKIQSLFRHR
ncbi:glycosyl transferase [Candidatus Methylacidiphilum fumarolicum]|uniref:Glycosyltransferase n=2 Tax=Candidatus Methylacidiphilum fumarolicum TaxID=591154 RepID=I0JXB8_METFB|nr:glycosyltransferase [Candidatus Methylacidiphilum fumarolicum]MBW6414195.1 glycosyltransferase [Candidatus Methylacidiphilum fumarolicum]TFE69971.1 glycosyl transferase [Candidatus Methylacidiphilum fumarolicum]TFE73776.1 glycosyl transferase [Candidatus Methylacidiphilum fumarolicum]TFE75617.1 glycosyl transferase [Candidatus Methylacidiphilum fumarolicum]TFE76783.1 glycosyl transferase [Candidatus Methylacidiphilum fumarolicum]